MSAAEQEGQQDQGLSALLHEGRRFEPPQAFVAQANAKPGIYEEADADPLSWWEEQARSLEWTEPWTELVDGATAVIGRATLPKPCKLRAP